MPYICIVNPKVMVMCQTAVISENIVRLGTRTYRHSLEVLAPNEYHVGQLRRLNHDLDAFYEFLYSQCNTITERDYNTFGKQLTSMIGTLKSLYTSCKQIPKEYGIGTEAEKLKRNYSALYELNDDIRKYRIKAPKDAEWTALLSDASQALKKVASRG